MKVKEEELLYISWLRVFVFFERDNWYVVILLYFVKLIIFKFSCFYVKK